jgi:hypothetical protein
MKKRDKKLTIHRETVARLDAKEIAKEDLPHVVGGVITSCIQPNCCGIEPVAV